MNTAEIDAIDEQIARLRRLQRRAQRARTRDVAVKIAAELRSWIALKSKVQGAMLPEKDAAAAPVSERDALQMAVAIIEANLAGDQRVQVSEWLTGLMERLKPPDAVPAEQSEAAEVGDITGTADIDRT